MNRIKNKTIFITGASSGIGAACARIFAQYGANLVLCARRMDAIQSLAEELERTYGINVVWLSLDVRDRDAVSRLLTKIPASFQPIDILLNNAGLAAGLDEVQQGSIDDWEAMIDTNIKGLLYVTRAILPTMVERKSGHILNIGSIAGHEVYPKGTVYCATKHAVKALSQGLRQDVLGTSIRVSSVDPGAVETNFSRVRFKGDVKRAQAVYEGYQPLTADDVADAVYYCASRPLHVNISDMIVMPTAQAAATIIAKN